MQSPFGTNIGTVNTAPTALATFLGDATGKLDIGVVNEAGPAVYGLQNLQMP